MHLKDFSLRESCNLVINDVIKSTGVSNLIKISIDIEVPDHLKGNANAFKERLKRITHWLSQNIINGVITVEISCKAKNGNNVTFQVNATGRDSGGGLQNVDTQSEFFKAHLRDRRFLSTRQLNFLVLKEAQFTIDTNIIRATYSETFRYETATRETFEVKFADKKVLLVEDNEINAMVFVSFMEDWGISITQARNGQEALTLGKQIKFNLVLMDIHMPVMNGIEATRALRALHSDVPIVALTASSLPEDMRDAYRAGVCGYLHKPVTSTQLFEALSQHMS